MKQNNDEMQKELRAAEATCARPTNENETPEERMKPVFDRKLFLECAVAGITFHDVEDIWDELYVGLPVALVREPKNPYDKKAVAVAVKEFYDIDSDEYDVSDPLGYVPRKDNALLAAMLDLGYEDCLEAEISELKNYGPFSDRLHINIYIRSRKPVQPKDDRLRIANFCDEEAWEDFKSEIWEKGHAFFRWGGFPPWEHDLPQKGDRLVFMRSEGRKTEFYLMMTIATDDDCAPFVDDAEELQMVDDCRSFVVTVVKGPVWADNENLSFLGRLSKLPRTPDRRLDKETSDALLHLLQLASPHSSIPRSRNSET